MTKPQWLTSVLRSLYSIGLHRGPIKKCHFYFLNSSVKHWPILIIFGKRHQKKNLTQRTLVLATSSYTVATLLCEIQ